jgi:Integrase core domain
VILSQLWKKWREVLIIVKPETVIKWHRQGFKLYWRWKSKAPVGRPKIDKEIRELMRKMSRENPLWGVPRIQAELRLLGFDLAESTVAKYRVRGSASPSQTWKTFLANHAKQIAAIDFFTVPTLPQSPFQNPYAERVIGSIRRECLDHLIIIGEDHLRRILRDYIDYYHNSRPHQALERNSPTPRKIEAPVKGKVISIPQVGGLHHRYRRAA